MPDANDDKAATAGPPPTRAATGLTPDGTWSGRFSEPMTERMQRFNASVDFDRRLARVDIAASLAHARMLAGTQILSADDLDAIERGFATILAEIDRGTFEWRRDFEDVHFNLERRLTALIGDAGKRLHTARSRNDQIATDVRLWLRGEIDALSQSLRELRRAFIGLAERHVDTIMPGYTHLQVAQPVTFGHHLMAYDAMLARDLERLADCRKRVNRMPLGSAALAGTSYPIDRERVARELGFEGVTPNSLDAVADRDFAIEFAAAAALVMLHLSRFAEELILWSNPRFGFVTLADRFCTGSSIMPQKKNPDVPELVRGKSARVTADLVASGVSANVERMREAAREGYATATDLADYLVRKGMPFRDAHEAVARTVRYAESKGVDLAALALEDFRRFAPQAGPDVKHALTLEASVASRDHPGGTAPA